VVIYSYGGRGGLAKSSGFGRGAVWGKSYSRIRKEGGVKGERVQKEENVQTCESLVSFQLIPRGEGIILCVERD